MRCAFVALLSLVLAHPVKAQESPKNQKSLNIAFASATSFTVPLWIAEEEKLFDKYGVRVNLIYVEGSAAATQSLVGGSADLVFASGSAAATAFGRGADVAIIATTGPTDFLLVSVPSVATLQEMRGGKTLGVSNFAAGDFFAARRLLAKSGLDTNKDIKFVNMGVPNPSRKLALMMQGVVSSTLVNPETLFEYSRKDPKPNVLVEAISNGVFLTIGDIIGLRTVIAKRSTEVSGFLKAYSEAIYLAKRDRSLVFKILQRRMNITDPGLLEAIYEARLKTLPDLPPFPSVDATQMAIDDMAASGADMSRLREIKAASLIDRVLLEKLQQDGFFQAFRAQGK